MEVARNSGNFIAAHDGSIFVGDDERIQEFQTDGTYAKSLPLPGERVSALAADPPSGNLYVALEQSFTSGVEPKKPNILKLDPATGEVLDEIEAGFAKALATDASGHLYALVMERKQKFYPRRDEVLEFDATGNVVIGPGNGFALSQEGAKLYGIAAGLRGDGTDTPGNVYVSAFSNTPAESYLTALRPGAALRRPTQSRAGDQVPVRHFGRGRPGDGAGPDQPPFLERHRLLPRIRDRQMRRGRL